MCLCERARACVGVTIQLVKAVTYIANQLSTYTACNACLLCWSLHAGALLLHIVAGMPECAL